ncbi:MAG: TonB-dependent receptor plug domain-containing protein, partial [Bacteroidales bacterium]|nr:TonB-dependent receptor plug domain-containing protein [Bacteroidales bacterium]
MKKLLWMAGLLLTLFSMDAFAQKTSTIIGVVVDEMDEPMPGVFVFDAANKGGGTMTSDKGSYRITVSSSCKNLTFEIMGYKTQVVSVNDATIVKLVPDSEMLQDVVVTGIYTRKAESFTGAVQSVTNEELKRVSNSNLFQSLQTLDPSLMVFDNLSQGSNPNAVASMQLRGASSFASESSDMKNPNTPLFILDGFEASLEKIQDLDMNRIESITILKDASAKAIYGSKAGNGVIVIETKSLRSGQTAVSYYGSLQVQMPDLTSYNLCNALEKLEIERREGYYESGMTSGNVAISIPGAHAEIMNIYYERLKRAMEGESTYWLSKPLHTSFDQKHTLEVELGTKDLKTMATLSFKDTPGVMMGSFRDNISGDITTSYRLGKWQFRNIMSYAKMWSEESPYGTFSDYTQMNPYDNPYDANGNIVKSFYVSVLGTKAVTALNPMYNATINTKSSDEYIDFTDNMYVEYQMFKS